MVSPKGESILNAFQIPEGDSLEAMLRSYYPGWYLHSYKDITEFTLKSHISLIAEMI